MLPEERFCPRCGVTAVWHGRRTSDASVSPAPTPAPTPSGAWDRVLERLRAATAGSYDILHELGRGGMAAVYLAREVRLSRLVAIKVMSPALLMDDTMVDRFRQEAVTLANVNHPNIVPIFTVQEVDDLHFFVMKFVEGRGLDAMIRDAAPMPVDMVRALLFEVGSALAAAHRRGIVHRDVKPANILVDMEGRAIVTDFGIAKVAEMPGHTVTGTTVGTPAYMSPEQCIGTAVTSASDQYSLGVVAYELLTGRPPFGGSTLVVMRAHTETPPREIRELRADCPEELASAVQRMLAKSPEERWPTLTQALAAAGAVAVNEESPEQVALAELASRGVTPIPAGFTGTSPRPAPASRGTRTPATPSATAPLPPSIARPAATSPARRWWLLAPVVAVLALAGWWITSRRTSSPPLPAPASTPVQTAATQGPVSEPSAPLPAPPPAPSAVTPTNTAMVVRIVRLDSAARTLHQGERRTLRMEHGVAATWSSARPEVASVNLRTGVVTAGQKAGRVWVVAHAAGAADSTEFVVLPSTMVSAAPSPSPANPPPAPSGSPAMQSKVAVNPPPGPVAPPPPPPPAAAGTAVPANADVADLITGCLKEFNSRQPSYIMRAYNPRDDVDQRNLDALLKAASGAKFNAALSAKAAPAVTTRGGGAMDVIFWAEFQVSGNFAVGSGTKGPFAFSLEAHRDAGKWVADGCRSTGQLKL